MMKKFIFALALLIGFPLMGNDAYAGPGLCRANASAPSWGEAKDVPCSEDLFGNTRTTPGTTSAGEDTLVDVLKIEQRFITVPVGGSSARISTDQLYKSGVGYVQGISCFSDAVATAGTVVLYDNTTAGAGNIIWSFDVLAIAYTTPFYIPLHSVYSVGLFLDFTTTADLFCTVSYR